MPCAAEASSVRQLSGHNICTFIEHLLCTNTVGGTVPGASVPRAQMVTEDAGGLGRREVAWAPGTRRLRGEWAGG